MKTLIRGGIRSAVIAGALALFGGAASAQYDLVWSDEFDGAALNPANWEIQTGTGTNYGLPAGWGNNELQFYTGRPENIVVADGVLRIIARNEWYGFRNYTSARIRTFNRVEAQYGRIEARIQLPSTTGIWPAFWMLATDSPYGGWAASGEIDIVESVNFADQLYGTIHFGGQWPENTARGGTYANGDDFSDGFRVYAIEWDPDVIRWYVDDLLYHAEFSANWFSSGAPGDPRAPFDTPFHLLLNVAVGGNFPGPPNGGVGFPTEMVVDYVRIYQRSQEAYLGVEPIPGTVEAEDYDTGGATVAYEDADAGNNGNAYRNDQDVDLEACSEGGFNIGWIREGEWTEYAVDVTVPGHYEVAARVASQSTGGRLRLEFDGVDRTGEIVFGATGGWQTWDSATAVAPLPGGPQTMRFANAGTTEQYNLNRFDFTLLAEQGDANADGSVDVDDLYELETVGDVYSDVDLDGTPATASDRALLVETLRAGESADVATR